jgi:wyosine [tRNA(Phe)-imidazoG37] synthetase (radical SAM superfamily)
LGEIEQKSRDRRIFIPTPHILDELQSFAPWEVDAITLSGSGEPTLALNLGELLRSIKALTGKPTGVLTNGSLLSLPAVREELAIADQVALKVDAVSTTQFRRINRPIAGLDLMELWAGFQTFRQHYTGHLALQTMLLIPWTVEEQTSYITLLQRLHPDEVQLNTPTRPRPLTHQLDARGNHTPEERPYPVHALKQVHPEILQEFGDRIVRETGIPVRYPQGDSP